MPSAAKASRPFVPPFPRRPSKPRGALSIILALRRNPIEIWCEADFERPVSLGRSILGLRGAAHDPVAVRRIFLDNAATTARTTSNFGSCGRFSATGCLASEGRQDCRRHDAAGALAPFFAPAGRTIRPAMQEGREAAIDRLQPAARRCGDGGRRVDVADNARGAGADALFARSRSRTERIPAHGHKLFRHHRQTRPPRSRGRAQLAASVWTPSRPSGLDVLRPGGRRHH